ncbi:MAG TPA: SgcJ/EcaC family oxidoreductase [Gemmatimonadaceae bacterium]|nr:SgcJ/EcaC family oxidoreductase [Gemmatimonadaceae bacterium]
MSLTTRLRVVVPLAAFALGACSHGLNTASDEQQIRAAGAEWRQAAAAGDVDRIVALHTPDAVLMTSNNPISRGSTGARASWNSIVNLPGVAIDWAPSRIDVVSPNVATEIGTYTLSYNGPQGRVNDQGNYTTIWHKIDGQWRVYDDATVSTTPFPAYQAPATAFVDVSDAEMLTRRNISWTPFEPPGFDPGVKLAVLHGNPSAKGDYTVRLRFPAGYRFPVHWHPGAEHLTVISGTFLLAMGDTPNWKAVRSYAPGDFVYAPARHPHYGGARGVTVVQLHGEGPFQLILGAPPQ